MPVFSVDNDLVKQYKTIIYDFVFPALSTVPYML